jgi:hypothetical protein
MHEIVIGILQIFAGVIGIITISIVILLIFFYLANQGRRK